MNIDFEIKEHVYFLDCKKDYSFKNILSIQSNELHQFNSVIRYGKIQAIHIKENSISFDIFIYNCYGNVVDEIMNVPDYFIAKSEEKCYEILLNLVEKETGKIIECIKEIKEK